MNVFIVLDFFNTIPVFFCFFLNTQLGPNGLTQAFRLFCNYPSGNLNDFSESFPCHSGLELIVMNPAAFHPIGTLRF